MSETGSTQSDDLSQLSGADAQIHLNSGSKAEETTNHEDSISRPFRLIKALPLVLFVGIGFVVDLVLFPVFSTTWIPGPTINILVAMFTGLILGQACLLIIVAGLCQRRWVEGLLIATLLGATIISLLIAGRYLQSNVFGGLDAPVLWSSFDLPLVLLAAALPLYAMRFFWGMHLTRRTSNPPRQGRGLEEFLIAMAVVGSCLFLASIPQVAWETRADLYWQAIGSVVIFLAGISLLSVVPLVGVVFLVPKRRYRYAALAGMGAMACTAAGLFGGTLISPPLGPAWLTAIAIGAVPFTYVLLGLGTLRFSGFRLSRFQAAQPTAQSAPIPNADPFEENAIEGYLSDKTTPRGTTQTHATHQADWRSRGTAAALLILAACGSVVLSRVNLNRRQAYLQNSALAKSFAEKNTTIQVHDRTVMRVAFGPATTDEDLAEIEYLSELRSILLNDTQITDAACETLVEFPKLRELDLSGTAISAKGLLKLVELNLYQLDLSRTELSVEAVNQFLSARSQLGQTIHQLDLSEMNWSFDDLKQLQLNGISSLGLRGYGLRDNQLLELFPNDAIFPIVDLDLRDNQLTGSFLAEFNKPVVHYGVFLKLDGNPLNDREVTSALTTNPLNFQSLSLSRTNLTDACLPALALCAIDDLVLGEGKITEQGLALNNIPVISIHLNAPQFKGEEIKTITQGSYPHVDLSNSGVTDESLASLKTSSCSILDLSNTGITDRALPELGKFMFPAAIDLSDTQVTAKGLLNGDLAAFQRVIVAFGQFSDDEVERISKVINLEVGTVLDPDDEFYLWQNRFTY